MGGKGYRVSDFDRRLSTMSEDLPPQMRRRQTLTISGKKFSLSSGSLLIACKLIFFSSPHPVYKSHDKNEATYVVKLLLLIKKLKF